MPGEKTFYGHLALDMIKQLHVSKFFLAPSAVSLDFGISDHIHEMIAVQRALIAISDQIIVQADSSKFETCAALKVCDLNPPFPLFHRFRSAGRNSRSLQKSRTSDYEMLTPLSSGPIHNIKVLRYAGGKVEP